jgi:hypothetical protein
MKLIDALLGEHGAFYALDRGNSCNSATIEMRHFSSSEGSSGEGSTPPRARREHPARSHHR